MGLALTELHKLPGYQTAPRIWRGGVRVLDPKWVEEASLAYRLYGYSKPLSAREERIRRLVIQDNRKPSDEAPAAPADRESIFAEIKRIHAQGRLTPTMLIVKMAHAYGYTANDLRSDRRWKPLILARHHTMYEMKRLFPTMSLPAIGRKFGDRDHTTCMYAIRRWPLKAKALGIPVEPIEQVRA